MWSTNFSEYIFVTLSLIKYDPSRMLMGKLCIDGHFKMFNALPSLIDRQRKLFFEASSLSGSQSSTHSRRHQRGLFQQRSNKHSIYLDYPTLFGSTRYLKNHVFIRPIVRPMSFLPESGVKSYNFNFFIRQTIRSTTTKHWLILHSYFTSIFFSNIVYAFDNEAGYPAWNGELIYLFYTLTLINKSME